MFCHGSAPGSFLDGSSEEGGEFESAEESTELGVGQDQGWENASLVEQPQLGHWMSRLRLRESSHRCQIGQEVLG